MAEAISFGMTELRNIAQDRRAHLLGVLDTMAGCLVLLNGVLMMIEFELEGRLNGTVLGFGQVGEMRL